MCGHKQRGGYAVKAGKSVRLIVAHELEETNISLLMEKLPSAQGE